MTMPETVAFAVQRMVEAAVLAARWAPQGWEAEVGQSHFSYYALAGSSRQGLRRMPSEPMLPAPSALCAEHEKLVLT